MWERRTGCIVEMQKIVRLQAVTSPSLAYIRLHPSTVGAYSVFWAQNDSQNIPCETTDCERRQFIRVCFEVCFDFVSAFPVSRRSRSHSPGQDYSPGHDR
ncbi:hypothetical protein D8B26_002442 [Coccidioides posadasii str. Silveira]|uniref:uncharacterized protein n=1 Tax=Coccidioides posadasii (strain RMSCC 757 / Silveira) TaxID=443226 RepID=UPI001BEE3CA5|nr:hypothetical protein D8B26_002442 [Coccidioides posadasii str. Silveira]